MIIAEQFCYCKKKNNNHNNSGVPASSKFCFCLESREEGEEGEKNSGMMPKPLVALIHFRFYCWASNFRAIQLWFHLEGSNCPSTDNKGVLFF